MKDPKLYFTISFYLHKLKVDLVRRMATHRIFNISLVAGILIALYTTSFYSYLLFHSTVETFSIIIACSVFMLVWNARDYIEDNYLMFLGIAYLFIGGLDLLHTLSYRGMGVFSGNDANLPTQLWIIARYTESVSLFSAFYFLKRKLNVHFLFIAYIFLIGFLLGMVFYWGIFPVCYIEGYGLTTFKKVSEYAISLILLITMVRIFRNRKDFAESVFRLLILSVSCTIFSELAFTYYIDVFGFSNLVGHYFKLFSFYLIYKAIIETGLVEPYELLFRRLKQREEALGENNQKLEQEISERKKIESALEQSNLEISQIFNGTADGIRVVDTDFNVLKVNEPFLNYVDLKANDAYRLKCYELFHGSDCQTDDCTLKQIVNGTERVERELEKTNPDGSKIFVNLIAKPYRNVKGELLGVIESFKDVSRTKEVEKIIREERDLFMEGFVVVIKWKNAPGWPIEYVSPNINRVLGYSVERFISREFLYAEMIAQEDLKWVREKKNQAIEAGLAHEEYEPYRIKGANGSHRWILDHTRFTENEEGNVDYFYGYLLDVSNYRENEEILAKQAKLAHAGRLTALGEMASGMAHELNQPMTVIRLAADGLKSYLSENNPGSTEEEAAEDIINQVKRAAKIIKNMRSFSSKGDDELHPVQIDESIENAVSFFREQFRIHQIELEVALDKDLPEVQVDTQKFEQIVINFLTNARYAVDAKNEYAGSGYRMKVSVRLYLTEDKKQIVFEVEDNGISMSSDVTERCLDPFFTTKKVGEGTGLGLSIVHGIVREFGMTIEIHTLEGEGCLFRVLIPVAT